jgi:hypothetical protein
MIWILGKTVSISGLAGGSGIVVVAAATAFLCPSGRTAGLIIIVSSVKALAIPIRRIYFEAIQFYLLGDALNATETITENINAIYTKGRKMLTEEQRRLREGKLTASRISCLMTGDREKIYALWREMVGDPTYEEPNLDEVWAVQLGNATERLSLDWYERLHSPISRRGEVVVHPDFDWAAATLDGFDVGLPGPVEAKHVSGFEKYETVLARYMPQLHWQMECTQTKKCAFSVIQGARQPFVEIVEFDMAYGAELMSRAKKLMECIWNLTPPVELDPVDYQKASALKDYDFTGSNHWAAYAKDFLDHQKAAKLFKDAETQLKGLIPDDARSVSGHGVFAKRDRALRISVRPGIYDPKSAS